MRLFESVSMPTGHRNDRSATFPWYTWSRPALHKIAQHINLLRSLPAPSSTVVRACRPYPASYHYPFSTLTRGLRNLALHLSEALLREQVGRNIFFLCRMFDAPLSSATFHKLLTLVRSGVVWINGDPRAALHSPVKTERFDEGFPLHADLYLTERLFLVFDAVPSGRVGSSLFLARDVFDQILKEHKQVPRSVRRRLQAILNHVTVDSFQEYADLLYRTEETWAVSLRECMHRRCWSVKLRRGEGFLLNDRKWLHGRTSTKARITASRFRRLTYGLARSTS
jgi:hypothetical protein